MRILVAGASTGIGLAVAEALTQDGHDVVGWARRPMARELYADHQAGGRLRFRECDITDEDRVRSLFRELDLEDPAAGLDALLVTAGTFGAIGKAQFTDSTAWWETLRTNLFGPYLVVKHAVPLLRKAPRPRVVLFSGGGAFGPFPFYSAYAASKAAVVRLMECLAVELRPIAVNAIAPGMVDTPIHQATVQAGAYRAGRVQFQRTLEMQEQGGWVPMAVPVACVRWLLSRDAEGLTGRTIAANFDDWSAPAFVKDAQADPQAYTMIRVGLAGTPMGLPRLEDGGR